MGDGNRILSTHVGSLPNVMAHQPAIQGAHLVGSLPLDTAEQVFGTVSAHLSKHVRRIPDGETGPRSQWIGWAVTKLMEAPQLEHKYPPYRAESPRTLGLRAGASARDVRYPNLEYADAALASFERFAALQREGLIPADCRFQVSMGTPVATSSAIISDAEFSALEPGYEAAQMAELQRMLDAIPHEKLAIQWDVCIEIVFLEGWFKAPFEPVLEGCVERLARYSNAVPKGVELGFHYCYGDYKHEHFRQPRDIQACVDLINPLNARVVRDIDWIHMPVPIERTDSAYFRPLATLETRPETEIYLGLIHFRDGLEGARRRIAAAREFLPRFGVATECGMGRREPGRGGEARELARLLDLHAALADPVR
jgi:hypothetical protein